MAISELVGIRKFAFHQYIKLYVFIVYLRRLLKKEFSLAQFMRFIKRSLLFLDRVKMNKIIRVRGVYKIHLYFPAFPTKAFFLALDKFLDKPYPTSVLLSMTKACNYHCSHCYQKKDTYEDLTLLELEQISRDIQKKNISFINIEGGEPLLKFDRLLSLLDTIDDRREVWINSTGYSLTLEKARELKDRGVFGMMISLHHPDKAKHDLFVGKKGAFDIAISSLKVLKQAGLAGAVNCTGTKEMIATFDKLMDLASDSDMVQLIHEKPSGAWIAKDDTLRKDYVDRLKQLHVIYNKKKGYPALSSQAFESSPENFGCTAGGIERFYVNANGDIQPCEFVNISFGNIREEPFDRIYKRMRKVFARPRTGWICCTEHHKIAKMLQESTPLSWKDSKHILKDFDFGDKTPLYKKMRLY